MPRNKKNKKNYQSFDSWLSQAKDTLNEIKEEVEKELEEENSSKKTYGSKKKPTVYRKFSNNKDVRELFPRDKSTKTTMDKKSHEGKVNKKGSIDGKTMMGPEGDPINPDLRKRLEEKRAKDLREKREKKLYKKDSNYKRKSVKTAEKHARIKTYKDDLKDKEKFRRAVIMSEILAPPLAKRKKF